MLSALATRTKECAAGGLHTLLDGSSASVAWLPGAIVNAEAFLVEIRGAGRAAEVEKSIVEPGAGVIQRDGAAALNGLSEDSADGAP